MSIQNLPKLTENVGESKCRVFLVPIKWLM